MEKQPKRHHYVPKFLLKNFSESDKVYVFEKRKCKSFKNNISNTFVEKDFNTIQKSIKLEEAYGKIETASAPIIAKIIKGGSINWIDGNEKKSLIEFFAVQYERTHIARDNCEKTLSSIIKMNLDMMVASGKIHIPDELKEKMKCDGIQKISDFIELKIDPDFIKSLIRTSLPEGIENTKKLILIKNMMNNFYISDQCAIMYNQSDLSPLGSIGYLAPGVEMYLPLSPKYTLGIFCRDFFYYSDLDTITADKELVEYLNCLQLMWSRERIASRHNDFEYAIKMLEKYPMIKEHQMYELKADILR